jgi:recombination protein RecT
MGELQINAMFKPIEGRLIELIDEKTIIKECNYAMQLFAKSDYLNKSTTESKQQAVLNVAQCGLTLNPTLKLAYLVPRFNSSKNVIECVLEPSYQGLAKLVTDTGSAKSIACYPVFNGDEFSVSLGTNIEIKHNPKYTTTEITHAYSVAVLSDGSKMIEVMTAQQINDIRDGSESYKSFKAGKVKTCIWEKDYSEMCRKTVIKRIVKYLPKTEMWDKLAKAIEIDNSDYGVTDNQRDYIESLLVNANIEPEESRYLYAELNVMTSDRAKELIEYLKENQVDAITAGRNYGQTEIKNKLKTEV